MPHYHYSGSKRRLSADEVREKDKETQIDIMREWFYYNFEDPSEHMPYESGDYFYINGGPYEPCDVLGEEFDGIVPENVILVLVEELNIMDWAPTSCGNYYSDGAANDSIGEFDDAINNINNLLSIQFHNTPSDVVSSMHRLLYANVIVAIEVYLLDKFKGEIIYNDSATKHFVETYSYFKGQKCSISDIYKKMNRIKNTVDDYLTKFTWHKLNKAEEMYENTFGIRFPANMETINTAISIRHDIMHRNGKKINGNRHNIGKTEVKNLIDEAQKFVSHIENEINNREPNMTTK